MAGSLPFEVELVDVFGIFCLDQLSDELELLSESQDGLLENSHFSRRPFFEDKSWGDGVDEDIEISFFIEVVDCVEVELNRLLLFLGVGLVYFVLGLDYLQNGMLIGPQPPKQLHECVVFALVDGVLNIL